MGNDNQRAHIARHVRELRRHLLPILDWIESQLGPPAPEVGMAHAIETALGMEPSEDGESLNDRHYWVLSQLAQNVKLTKRGLIEFCADPRPGFYRLCHPDLLKELRRNTIARSQRDKAE